MDPVRQALAYLLVLLMSSAAVPPATEGPLPSVEPTASAADPATPAPEEPTAPAETAKPEETATPAETAPSEEPETTEEAEKEEETAPPPDATPETPGVPGFERTLWKGLSGRDVLLLQQRLIELGYMQGEAVERFGNKTYQGVLLFQKTNGLTEDGVAGPETLRRVFAEDAVRLIPEPTPTPTLQPAVVSTPTPAPTLTPPPAPENDGELDESDEATSVPETGSPEETPSASPGCITEPPASSVPGEAVESATPAELAPATDVPVDPSSAPDPQDAPMTLLPEMPVTLDGRAAVIPCGQSDDGHWMLSLPALSEAMGLVCQREENTYNITRVDESGQVTMELVVGWLPGEAGQPGPLIVLKDDVAITPDQPLPMLMMQDTLYVPTGFVQLVYGFTATVDEQGIH